MTLASRTTSLAAAVAAAILLLAGCSTPSTPAEAAPAAEAITLTDAWAKSADEGMTAAFGMLANTSDQDVTITSATSPAATMIELHETVDDGTGQMVMREVEGGFVIPAGGMLDLAPGGNHLMFMGLTAPMAAGDEVTITLTFSDGSTTEFTAPVKDYSGANENYEGGDDHHGDDHGGDDHGDHDH